MKRYVIALLLVGMLNASSFHLLVTQGVDDLSKMVMCKSLSCQPAKIYLLKYLWLAKYAVQAHRALHEEENLINSTNALMQTLDIELRDTPNPVFLMRDLWTTQHYYEEAVRVLNVFKAYMINLTKILDNITCSHGKEVVSALMTLFKSHNVTEIVNASKIINKYGGYENAVKCLYKAWLIKVSIEGYKEYKAKEEILKTMAVGLKRYAEEANAYVRSLSG